MVTSWSFQRDTCFKHIVLLIYDGLEKKTVVMKKSMQKVDMRVTLQCNDYTLHEGSIPSDKMLRSVVKTTSYLGGGG